MLYNMDKLSWKLGRKEQMSRARAAIRRGRRNRASSFITNTVILLIAGSLTAAILGQFIGPFVGWADPYLAMVISQPQKVASNHGNEEEAQTATEEPVEEEVSLEMAPIKFDLNKLKKYSPETTKKQEPAARPKLKSAFDSSDPVKASDKPELVESKPIIKPIPEAKAASKEPVNQKSDISIQKLVLEKALLSEPELKETKSVTEDKLNEPTEKVVQKTSEPEIVKTADTVVKTEPSKPVIAKPIRTNGPVFGDGPKSENFNVTPGGSSAGASAGPLKYDVNYRKSPQSLAPVLKHFYNWVGVQERRVKGRLVSKMWAVPQGNNIVLYVKVTDYFSGQSRDLRSRVGMQFQKGWSDRLMSFNKISNPNQGHVVLINGNNKIIGGSKEDNAEKIWAK